MIEDVALEMIPTLGKPGVLIGDGTMPYPGNSRVLEAPDVAKTVKETKLGKMRLLLGEAAVPDASGLLEMAVCSGITDMEFVNRVAERLPVPCATAADDVKVDGKVKDGCDKEKMM